MCKLGVTGLCVQDEGNGFLFQAGISWRRTKWCEGKGDGKVGGCHDDERKGFMKMHSSNYADSRGQAGSLVFQHCGPSPQETGAQKT